MQKLQPCNRPFFHFCPIF